MGSSEVAHVEILGNDAQRLALLLVEKRRVLAVDEGARDVDETRVGELGKLVRPEHEIELDALLGEVVVRGELELQIGNVPDRAAALERVVGDGVQVRIALGATVDEDMAVIAHVVALRRRPVAGGEQDARIAAQVLDAPVVERRRAGVSVGAGLTGVLRLGVRAGETRAAGNEADAAVVGRDRVDEIGRIPILRVDRGECRHGSGLPVLPIACAT